MAKDYRLDLGRYIDYTKDVFTQKKQLNFDDLFSSKASTGAAPWMPSRFEATDLLRKVQTRKLKLNPSLNFVGDNPEEYEVFANIGRFTRKDGYDFNAGRPLTKLQPQNQPGYNPMWMDAYNLSPTLKPDDRISNPMPRMSNPDPNGYIMASAENRAKNELEGNKSVSQLITQKTEEKTTDGPSETSDYRSKPEVKPS
jgi:hypothetical protein